MVKSMKNQAEILKKMLQIDEFRFYTIVYLCFDNVMIPKYQIKPQKKFGLSHQN